MKINFEYTDTFGGESNYSWVRRESVDMPEKLSDRAIVQRAKKFAGLTGIRCRTDNLGDGFALYPSGSCTVLFVTFDY